MSYESSLMGGVVREIAIIRRSASGPGHLEELHAFSGRSGACRGESMFEGRAGMARGEVPERLEGKGKRRMRDGDSVARYYGNVGKAPHFHVGCTLALAAAPRGKRQMDGAPPDGKRGSLEKRQCPAAVSQGSATSGGPVRGAGASLNDLGVSSGPLCRWAMAHCSRAMSHER
jgi:hypothetical protein